MFTVDGKDEFSRYAKWISDDDFDFSPDFIPTEETPKEAIEYYKSMMGGLVDFDAPDFTWPTGVGMCC